LESYRVLKLRLGESDPRAREARQRLRRLYVAWNKPDQAAQYR
jgi:hypothetical protein